jgi:osmoprotectant transport system substrate-binding protein
MKKVVGICLVFCIGILPLTAGAADKVNVASKGFTEQVILGKIMVHLLKDRGVPVKDRTSLGGTKVCREALEQGQIDVYMEYTGTAWLNFFKMKETVRDSMGLYNKVKAMDAKKGLIWLAPAKFNNTYAIVMQRDKADKMGIQSLSDWAAWSKKNSGKMSLATNAEFYGRPDGFKGMMEFYGLTFGKEIPDTNVRKMETPLCKKAVRDNQVLSGMAFATDGEIKAYDQAVLADDKFFFPIYNPAPVVRKEVLDKYPQIKFILGDIGESLDTATMTRLNYRVNVNGEKPDLVAKSWLTGVGLIVKKKK